MSDSTPLHHIILISCSQEKGDARTRARDLYTSPLFRKSLQWAESQKPDAIYIVSALYGLVRLEESISPYNFKITDLRKAERWQWAGRVRSHLTAQVVGGRRVSAGDRITILAGKDYVYPLREWLPNLHAPLAGLQVGERLRWLNLNTPKGGSQ